MQFVASVGGSPPVADGGLHVGGGSFNTYASPGLIVQFTTLQTDFIGSLPTLLTDHAPVSISGYAGTTTDIAPPVIVGALHST
jgi:hypothetical protein